MTPMGEQAVYLFAGGGTGGHLFPGLAVAHALRERDPDARIVFLTTTRDLDRKLLSPTGFEQITQVVQPLASNPLRWPRFWWSWRTSVAAARRLIRRRKPRAVLGLGGYAAGPPVVAAKREGARAAILNPDAVPGRANRYLGRFASLVVTQFDVSAAHFPIEANCQRWGCPIRATFATQPDVAQARAHFKLDPEKPTIVVTGASQGARTINEALPLVWGEFAKNHPDWQILHLAGEADAHETRVAYARSGAPAAVLPFTHDMHLALGAADVVVSRAGASTLAELTALGKPSVLLPYPYHRDQHQRHNAQALVDAGAAIIVEDRKSGPVNAVRIREALMQLGDSTRRAEMTVAAATLGQTNAAARVAAWMAAGGEGADVDA